MYGEQELLTFLLSRQKEILAKAIGCHLIEVERFFEMDLESFLKYCPFTEVDFFSRNSGSLQLCFDEGLTHTFTVYGEQLSLVLLPKTFSGDGFGKWYRLSEADNLASEYLKDCLGKICQDVCIWTLHEDFESEEAKEVAVSYLFSNSCELFYCIYLHEDLDSDYLLLEQDVKLDKAASCFSLLLGDYIEPTQRGLAYIKKYS